MAVTPPTTSRNQLWLVNFSNNRRGSIADRHGFINSLPRQQQLSHFLNDYCFLFLACSPHHVGLLADYSFVYASRRVFTGATLC
jgi:hypothetical protein